MVSREAVYFSKTSQWLCPPALAPIHKGQVPEFTDVSPFQMANFSVALILPVLLSSLSRSRLTKWNEMKSWSQDIQGVSNGWKSKIGESEVSWGYWPGEDQQLCPIWPYLAVGRSCIPQDPPDSSLSSLFRQHAKDNRALAISQSEIRVKRTQNSANLGISVAATRWTKAKINKSPGQWYHSHLTTLQPVHGFVRHKEKKGLPFPLYFTSTFSNTGLKWRRLTGPCVSWWCLCVLWDLIRSDLGYTKLHHYGTNH